MLEALLLIGTVVLLLLLQGFFSGSEIALINCDKTRLRLNAKAGHHGSILALKMLERPEVVLTTTLVGTNISLVLLTVLVTTFIISWLGSDGDLLAILLLTPLTLIIGEVVPKSIFQQKSDELTPSIVYILYALSLLLFPIVFLFSKAARLVTTLVGGGSSGDSIFAVREQLRAVLETADSAAPDSPFDRIRIKNVVRFGELSAADLMLPASELMAVNTNASLADAISFVRDKGYSHVPVYEGKKNNVVGIMSLTAWDLVEMDIANTSLSNFVKKALYIPTMQPVAELLPMLQSRDDHSAIVVDEFGSSVGFISVDMILESIVGPVEFGQADESHNSTSKPGYTCLENDAYLMDARFPVKDVNDLLAISLSTAIAHTIGGYITARLRHAPLKGETLEEKNLLFTVEEVSDRAILRLRVERMS